MFLSTRSSWHRCARTVHLWWNHCDRSKRSKQVQHIPPHREYFICCTLRPSCSCAYSMLVARQHADEEPSNCVFLFNLQLPAHPSHSVFAQLLIGISLALPFLGVRMVYTVLASFSGSPKATSTTTTTKFAIEIQFDQWRLANIPSHGSRHGVYCRHNLHHSRGKDLNYEGVYSQGVRRNNRIALTETGRVCSISKTMLYFSSFH